MKEVLVYVSPDKALKTEIHNAPIPTPGPDQVVIRNVVVGTNPKDWKYPVIRAIVSQSSSLRILKRTAQQFAVVAEDHGDH
jgi:NADPH:quinone reductase-like Zn-dependent oxidoreductase